MPTLVAERRTKMALYNDEPSDTAVNTSLYTGYKQQDSTNATPRIDGRPPGTACQHSVMSFQTWFERPRASSGDGRVGNLYSMHATRTW